MRPFGDSSGPVVIGHRGAPLVAPENTPAAFAAAHAAGATWVELDARRSADGAVIVHHDARVADGTALIELTRTELRTRGVTTLADVLAGLPAGLGVDVEVKNLPGEPDYDEDEVLAGLVAGLLGDARRPAMTSSFNPMTVTALQELLPRVPAGLLTTRGLRPRAGVDMAVEVGARVYCPHRDTPDLGAAAVEAAHRAGLAVLVWTVDDPARARTLAGAGVDALCTNDPAGLVQALEQ
ncbi:MAG TPA: glycerophosphodiester phosphodiesterase [Egibacteraceae bacterium]|nr:glycerophosphodiester phosphodiesterase [Egibacteraceae bacterium]